MKWFAFAFVVAFVFGALLENFGVPVTEHLIVAYHVLVLGW